MNDPYIVGEDEVIRERRGYIGQKVVIVECEQPDHSKAIETWLLEFINPNSNTLYKFRIIELFPANIQTEKGNYKIKVSRIDPSVIPHSEDSLTWKTYDWKEFYLSLPSEHFAKFLLDKTMISLCNEMTDITDLSDLKKKMQKTSDIITGVLADKVTEV